ncbi:MAG: intracellular septation protein [Planctomycetota bacterium]
MNQSNSNNSPDAPTPGGLPGWVRPALEFGPILIFFVVQRATRDQHLGGLYWATIALMVTTAISVLFSRIKEKRWPPVALITGVVVGVMGGLTIYLDSELFIKIKPTIINCILGGLLLGGLMTGRLFLRNVLGKALPMREEGWRIFTKRMVFYFFALAIGNEILRRTLNTDDWTMAKTFGFGPAGFVFLLAQGPLIERYSTEKSEKSAKSDEESQAETPSGQDSGPE